MGVKRISGDTVQERISKFLFTFRTTLHSTTGAPPAQLVMACRLRSTLDLLHPEMSEKVET